MSIVKIIIGYIFISAIIGSIFLLSFKLNSLISRKADKMWIDTTYILSFISLLIVLIFKIFYKEEFSIIGGKSILSMKVLVQMFIAAFVAAGLASLAKPEQYKSTLKAQILTGMAMEVPMRGLVQNLFVILGATAVLFHSITLSIVLTAIFWVQFILIQEIMMKRKLSSKVVLDSIASMWFSIWVGVIYLTTGSMIVAMITHALERWFAYMIRKKKSSMQNTESELY